MNAFRHRCRANTQPPTPNSSPPRLWLRLRRLGCQWLISAIGDWYSGSWTGPRSVSARRCGLCDSFILCCAPACWPRLSPRRTARLRRPHGCPRRVRWLSRRQPGGQRGRSRSGQSPRYWWLFLFDPAGVYDVSAAGAASAGIGPGLPTSKTLAGLRERLHGVVVQRSWGETPGAIPAEILPRSSPGVASFTVNLCSSISEVCWSTALEPSCRRPQLDNRQVFPAIKIRHFRCKVLARSERSHRLASHSLIGSL